MARVKPESTSRFIKLRCPGCKNEQIIFEKSASEVKCLVCGKILALPRGGKANISGQVLEVLA